MEKIKNSVEEVVEELIEQLADIEHQRWADWQKYMFSKMYDVDGIGGEPTGDMLLPKEFVDRWNKQIDTAYSELSEEEKDSDREQVKRYIHLIEQALTDYGIVQYNKGIMYERNRKSEQWRERNNLIT